MTDTLCIFYHSKRAQGCCGLSHLLAGGFPQLIVFLMINSSTKLVPGAAPLRREMKSHSRPCRGVVSAEASFLPVPPASALFLSPLYFSGCGEEGWQKGVWLGGRVRDHWLPSHGFENKLLGADHVAVWVRWSLSKTGPLEKGSRDLKVGTLLPSPGRARIAGKHYHAWVLQCWGWSPGLGACHASILPTLQPQPCVLFGLGLVVELGAQRQGPLEGPVGLPVKGS